MEPGTYISFLNQGVSPSGKTGVWEVITNEELAQRLGCVRWHSPWRCYAFFADSNTLYEKKCLREIAEFLEAKTKEQREGWRREGR